MSSTDAGDIVSDAINDFFSLLFKGLVTAWTRFKKNMYASVADVGVQRWIRVGVIVFCYILARPYIDLFFRKWWEWDQRRKREKEKAQKAAFGATGKKAKVSANSLRGSGKVLGEVENTDDEIEEDEAKASGVPEWGKMARKRQKKYLKSLEKEAEKRAEQLSDEQLLELLDWSDSDEEKDKPKATEKSKKEEEATEKTTEEKKNE